MRSSGSLGIDTGWAKLNEVNTSARLKTDRRSMDVLLGMTENLSAKFS
jgi:hypothetical protein